MDLAEVRIRLDQMTERIISRLKDRSRFPVNPSVYTPGAVPIAGRDGISFLDFSIEGLERYHGSLGRYAFPDQFPLSGGTFDTPVRRAVDTESAPRIEIPIHDELLAFYRRTIDRLCLDGDKPGTWGETVYIDADLLQLLHERINIGRQVATAKAETNASLSEILQDRQALSEALRDRAREEKLLEAVEATARRYELDPLVVRQVFVWIIETTLDLEVSYLQRLARAEAGAKS